MTGRGYSLARGLGALAVGLAAMCGAAAALAQAPGTDDDGLFLGAPEAAAGEAAPATGLTAREARGVVEPAEAAVLSAEVAARIADAPPREGEAFAAGDVLVGFDCALFEARHAQARAAHKGARSKLGNVSRLYQNNAIGAAEVSVAAAEAEKAAAVVTEAEVALSRCRITAPFNGRVVEIMHDRHEVAAPGEPLLAVVSTDVPDVRLLVPSPWLVWLDPGQAFTFTVDETGAGVPGTVVRLGARVDPISQTVPVFGRLDPAPDGPPLVPGMSGTARFPAAPAAPDAG